MRKFSTVVAFVLFGVIALGPAAFGSRVTLLDRVDVQGNSIFLADLLPAGAPASMRTAVQGILVGASPQPGSARILDGDKIVELLGAASARDIDVPRQIVVRRAGRLLTREEVVAAIREALKHNGMPDDSLRPEDLRVFPDVLASADDPSLEVRRIDFDDTLRQAKFLMAQRGELPFLVTAQFQSSNFVQSTTQESQNPLSANSAGGSTGSVVSSTSPAPARDDRAMLRLASGALVNAEKFSGPTLVEAGKPATLFLNSGTMQMLLDVTALDRGALNQTVRVRVAGTGKVLRAQVTGARRLEARF